MSNERDPVPLPELHEAIVNDEFLDDLFADIATVTVIHATQVRIDGRSSTPPFAEAAEAFRTGVAQAMQIQYAFGDDTWRDTLLRTDEGTRLVRIRVEAPR